MFKQFFIFEWTKSKQFKKLIQTTNISIRF